MQNKNTFLHGFHASSGVILEEIKFITMKKIVFFLILLTSFQITAQNWTSIQSNTIVKLNTISFGSDLVGYIGGNDSTLLKTINGGKTWSTLNHTGISYTNQLPDILHLKFVSELVGYCLIENADTLQNFTGGIYKTIDGGLTWSVENTYMCSPNKTFFFDEDNGYSIGSSCFGGKTIDRKTNGIWSVSTTYLSWNLERLRAIDFLDTLRGIVGGDSGQIHRTYDGGTTWDTLNTNTNYTINELIYLTGDSIYAVTSDPFNGMILSIDSGKNWSTINLSFYYPEMRDLVRSKKHEVVGVGSSTNSTRGIIYSKDTSSGLWMIDDVSAPLNSIDKIGDSTLFVVGDSGLIVTNKDFSTGVNEKVNDLIFSIFPNPASDYLIIEGVKEIKDINVFDNLGKDVTSNFYVKKNKILFPNTDKGIYYLRVVTKNKESGLKSFIVR